MPVTAWGIYLIFNPKILEFGRSLAFPSINQANLNPTRYGQIQIPLPPLPEQSVIAAYLDAETAKLDALVAKVETAIERLQEYRTALITAAVTGKIDVRNSIARAEDNQVCSDADAPPAASF